MIAVVWQYLRRGPDVYGDEPRARYSRVHLTDARQPGAGSYLMCGRAIPDDGDIYDLIVGDDAYSYADPCASCHRGRAASGKGD